MSALGLEPRTNGLKGHCSSIELRAQYTSHLSRCIADCILSRAISPVNNAPAPLFKFQQHQDILQSCLHDLLHDFIIDTVWPAK